VFHATGAGHQADKLKGEKMTLLEAPNTNSQAKQMISEVELPHRFDVHEVIRMTASIEGLAEHGRSVSIGGSAVEMIDCAALAALTACAVSIDIRIVDASVALLVTAKFTGHDAVVSCCDVGQFLEVA
jgi:anti-anti-sigma regulatory factor